MSDYNGVQTAAFGIVDAVCIGIDGMPELVVDWKSDVEPTAAASDHYRSQVTRYLEMTGIPNGLIVFVINGSVLRVSKPN